jgi:DNA-binding CsgD family transcriptional regulator
MEQTQLNLTAFRKKFSIPVNVLTALCNTLKVNTIKDGGMLFADLFNDEYKCDTDTLILFAFYEFSATGEVETTISKTFNNFSIKRNGTEELVSLEQVGKKVLEARSTYLTKPAGTMVLVGKGRSITSIKTASIGAVEEQGGDALVLALLKAISSQQKPVLSSYEELTKATQNGWLLTNDALADLLGISKNTISSKKTGWRKNGFEFEKVKEGTSTLWRVRQY